MLVLLKNMLELKYLIKKVKASSGAVIEAKRNLWYWSQQEILFRKGKTDK